MLQKIWSCRKDHRKEELQNDYRKEDHEQGRDAYQFSKDRMMCFFFFAEKTELYIKMSKCTQNCNIMSCI
jgi:hypothetical protein